MFFLLEAGDAYAVKKFEKEEEKKVMDYSRGSYFGELALLLNEKRAVSVFAKVFI